MLDVFLIRIGDDNQIVYVCEHKVGASGPLKFAVHDALKLGRCVPETEWHALVA
jgi:hypothetical protein